MKLPIRVAEESREPIYHQIETQIKALIIGGQLPAETPLPSIRVLAADLACSVITTRRAYQNLESEGFIITVQGKGTFVRKLETNKLEDTKERIIYDAFEKAVEQGEQIGYSEEELRLIFEEVVSHYYNSKKDGRGNTN